MATPPMHPDTLALHSDVMSRAIGAPVSASIVPASSFYTSPDAVGFSAADLSDDAPHFYSRWANPTVDLLEKRLAALEGGVGAVCYASGMAAISALFLTRLKAGDHLVLSDVCYAGVAEFAHDVLPRFGIDVSFVDTSNLEAVTASLRPEKTRLIHIETPANPILKLSDISAIAQIAHSAKADLSVDSTIATPIGTQPLLLGADYVVHSLTKYICGHGDALGGAIVVGDQTRLPALRQGALVHQGAALSPFAAWLIARGLETLPLRMRSHEANARTLAGFLQSHPQVAAVHWPGNANHPQAELARAQMRNFSGLLSFRVKSNGAAIARRLAERLKVVSYAVSLGKTRSLIYYIPTNDLLRTSFKLSSEAAKDYRAWAGDGVFRLSVGLEHPDDLMADLSQAL
jgi:cystathionine gamma-synthase